MCTIELKEVQMELNHIGYCVKHQCKNPKEMTNYIKVMMWDLVDGHISEELGSFTLDRIQNAVIHKVLQEGYSVNWI